MPTSYIQAIPHIVHQVLACSPASILDLGVGFGKYGVLLREVLELPYRRYARESWQVRIDGIEGYAGYRNPIHDHVYNKVHYGLIEDVLPGLGVYDVLLALDVLEHYAPDAGRRMLAEAVRHARRTLIVSTPVVPAELKPYLDNRLEQHLSRWIASDFRDYPCECHVVKVGAGGALVAVIRGGAK